VKNELIVGHEVFDEEMAAVFDASEMTLRIVLIDKGDQTLLRLTQGPYSDEFETMTRAGWNASFTKSDVLFLKRLGLLDPPPEVMGQG